MSNIIQKIRQKAPIEEIDYTFLMSCLHDYKRPRDKITDLLRSKALIRVKKGIYVFGPQYARKPFYLETLANLIYGPSYVSKEYALAYYNMIPERAYNVTSMTSKRNKTFITPVGSFIYQFLPMSKYGEGVTLIQTDQLHHILIATPEKALADLVAKEKGIDSPSEMLDFLFENLRLDENEFKKMRKKQMHAIAKVYDNRNVNFLLKCIEQK